jgi:hypothetical protein
VKIAKTAAGLLALATAALSLTVIGAFPQPSAGAGHIAPADSNGNTDVTAAVSFRPDSGNPPLF